jgi:hypothetical protein
MKMGILEGMNQRVKKFGIVDVKLAQLTAMFGALIIAKLIPQVMDINIGFFIALFVLCAIKPFCVFWS